MSIFIVALLKYQRRHREEHERIPMTMRDRKDMYQKDHNWFLRNPADGKCGMVRDETICSCFLILQGIHPLLLIILLLLKIVEHAKPEQIELRATIALPFDQLEPIAVPLQRACAPRQGQSCQNSIFVLLNAGDKGCKGIQLACLYLFEPSFKLLFSRALAHHL